MSVITSVQLQLLRWFSYNCHFDLRQVCRLVKYLKTYSLSYYRDINAT